MTQKDFSVSWDTETPHGEAMSKPTLTQYQVRWIRPTVEASVRCLRGIVGIRNNWVGMGVLTSKRPSQLRLLSSIH
jgi:hypothetical protein